MIKKIRTLLEYNTYCLWLYDENDEIIDNDNPPEWNDDQELTDAFMDDDQELTDAFMAVSDLYDTFFIDTDKEFRYVGCTDKVTINKLNGLINRAMELLYKKNDGKYVIQNDIHFDPMPD